MSISTQVAQQRTFCFEAGIELWRSAVFDVARLHSCWLWSAAGVVHQSNSWFPFTAADLMRLQAAQDITVRTVV
jgi:hypothetical protein